VRRAARITAVVLGLSAGGAGVEHGIFEILRGSARPEGIMIASMGPPCVPESSWNACEPAMTVIPSFLVTGILAVVLGVAVTIWSVGFVHRRAGGLVLIGLSFLLLLFGGGIFPPVIGIVAGALGTRINRPVPAGGRGAGGLSRLLAALWPWSLALYVCWILGQWVIGYFFNDWFLENGALIIVMVLATLAMTAITAGARDRQTAATGHPSG
jgi:hypothetical protein